jgi:hypothetical protein
MADTILTRILSECEAAGRRGEDDFFRVWHKVVCSVRSRTSYINQPTFDAARAAWERRARPRMRSEADRPGKPPRAAQGLC